MDSLIEKYITASINYGVAQEEGNARKVNRNASAMRKIMKQIKMKDPCYVEKLECLLEHENDYVRLHVAFDLLPALTDKAEKTLLDLLNKRGLLGFEAKMTLQEWKKGNLSF